MDQGLSLIDEALTDESLFQAWSKVRENSGGPGVDGVTLSIFGRGIFTNLEALRVTVRERTYQPAPLLERFIPKKSGKLRHLCIPTVRDRVLQSAVASAICPSIEEELEESCYAYRRGRSVQQAVARITACRDEGYSWVLDADIFSFFDFVDHEVLLEKLRRTLTDTSPLPLIEAWLHAQIRPDHGPPRLLKKGVPQGSPISPILANLYLDDFDEAILHDRHRLIRYADDFLILCRDRHEAEEALRLTENMLQRMKLRLNHEKTRITSFGSGFRFLGVDFLRDMVNAADPEAAPRLIPPALTSITRATLEEPEPKKTLFTSSPEALSPPLYPAPARATSARDTVAPAPADCLFDTDLDEDRPFSLEADHDLDPLMRSLIVTGQGYSLLKAHNRILVTKGQKTQESVPLNLINQIILNGNQMISTALLRSAAQQGIDCFFSDHGGTCQAALDRLDYHALETHRRQFHQDNDEKIKVVYGKSFVAGKIQNSRVLLRRYNRRRQITAVEDQQHQMGELAKRLERATQLNEVRGIEGMAARCYFTALQRLLPEHWEFRGRRKRPPADPFNTLISYGYGILFKTVLSFLHQRGLNPYLGVLHAARAGHPALASDLMEEFRAPIVDTVALGALLDGALKRDDFLFDTTADFPCRLNDGARQKYLQLLQDKFRSRLIHPVARQRMDYHRAIRHQVHHYARVLLGAEPAYQSFTLR